MDGKWPGFYQLDISDIFLLGHSEKKKKVFSWLIGTHSSGRHHFLFHPAWNVAEMSGAAAATLCILYNWHNRINIKDNRKGAETGFLLHAAAAAKSLQSCPTLCDPRDGSPPGSSVPGILQVRTLEWVAISFSNAWKWKVKVKLFSYIWLFKTSWTVTYQVPPSMGFSRHFRSLLYRVK